MGLSLGRWCYVNWCPASKRKLSFVRGHGYLFRWQLTVWPFVVWRYP